MVSVCFFIQRRQERLHVKSSVAQARTQQRLIKFPVAPVSRIGDPVSVVHNKTQLFCYPVVDGVHVVWTCLLATQTSGTVELSRVTVHDRAK